VKGRNIIVIGVGNNGCQIISQLAKNPIESIYTVAVDTDANTLLKTNVHKRLLIGDGLAHGQGASGNIEIGTMAAEESGEEIKEILSDSDVIFITAGLGGGTGSGAGPVVASIARNSGVITIGVVTTPFNFEGRTRTKNARIGLQRFRNAVDTLIVFPSDTYLQSNGLLAEAKLRTFNNIFCKNAIGFADLLTIPGLINLDVNDLREIVSKWNSGSIGYGYASGSDRASIAANNAIAGMMGELKLERAQSVAFSITGDSNMTLFEVNQAANLIRETTHTEKMIFGAIIDPTLEDKIQIAILATGTLEVDNNSEFDDSFPKIISGEKVSSTKRSLRVFLCHSSDDKPAVRKLYQHLFPRNGIDVWLDEARLLPGEDWNHEITKAVKDADIVIVCLSQNSISKEGYVQKEIRRALDIAEEKPEGSIFIIPLKIEDCIVPERLSSWQWLNYYEDGALNRLMKSLHKRAEALGIDLD
jgi:cell division protein FtsZ